MKLTLAILALALLAGCESTRQFAREHPVASGIGVAVLFGSIAASLDHSDSQKDPAQSTAIGPGPSCRPQPNGSCR